jgi:hypothetical protein
MIDIMKHVWAVLLVAGTAQAAPAKPPHGATKISIDYTWQSFSHDERHYTLAWDGTRYVSDKKKPIDGALVAALYASLTTTRETSDQMQCISHTDDYPAFVIKIEGDEPVTITSDSNCHAYVPWMIDKGGKLYVQFSGDAWRGLAPILAGLDGKWQGNTPVATTSMGGEMIGLGEYRPGPKAAGGKSTGDAEKCAHSFEINPQAKQLFGEIHVETAVLACDLGDSKDCTSDVAEATFAMAGLDAQIDFACTNGVASIPPRAAQAYADLQKLTSSKVVRAVVKVSKDRPRLWNNGTWSIEASSEDVPMLAWDPRGTTIEARTFGATKPNAAFWKELGIDPTPYVKVRDGFAELELKLDFAGRIVK